MGLDNLPDIITVKELAEFLKISVSTIRRAISSGELKSFKAGKNVRIEKESVMEWLEQKNK
ncbi:MAG TPA: DNA-binding protein [Clostridiales bacterium]|nr:DNA-binding protein [Clostridiales bacterium]